MVFLGCQFYLKLSETGIFYIMTLRQSVLYINAQKYIDILKSELWPVVARHLPTNNFIFHGENVPPHWALIGIEIKARNAINLIVWPAQSPGCYIVEHCCLLLKNK